MRLIYIDDSRDEKSCAFSALAVPASLWRISFDKIKEFRRSLRKSDGIYIYKELHAWKFVSGRGEISDSVVPKGRRCQIYKNTLTLVSQLDEAKLFNAIFPAKCEERAFERLINRINRTMQAWDSRAILICDEGHEGSFTRLARRLCRYNPIPSKYGTWGDTGTEAKNIPLDRIIEDPFFKKSDQSYFIQMADFCAYALLRKENPLPSKSKYDLHLSFEILDSILVREANPGDFHGIIRP
jgi:hypothetical protein